LGEDVTKSRGNKYLRKWGASPKNSRKQFFVTPNNKEKLAMKLRSLVFLSLVLAFAMSAMATTTKKQTHDPRIGQQEALALINMDPVDPSYVTDYDTHLTGVLLVPSSGPIEGKGGWYEGLAVPAGVLVDIPKGSTIEPYVFTAPNGETTDAVLVTIDDDDQCTINACGNGHKPKKPMVMKLIQPPTTPAPTVPEPAAPAPTTPATNTLPSVSIAIPQVPALDMSPVVVVAGAGLGAATGYAIAASYCLDLGLSALAGTGIGLVVTVPLAIWLHHHYNSEGPIAATPNPNAAAAAAAVREAFGGNKP
jgi:hypothetical protein